MRYLIATLLLLFAGLLHAGERPNILLIVADDLNCAVGPCGDRTAVTPNLDRLAARGLVFQRAYCQQAVCNPSRSSFLTGLRPNTVKVDDLRKSFRETAPGGSTLVTLPQHFKNRGYFCQNIGKIFHNMGETQDRRSWSIDEVLFKGTHAADTVYANTPPDLREPISAKAPVTESLDVPDTAYRDGQIANLAAAMLRDHPSGGQPFFLAVGFWRPHLPFVAPKKYWDLYDPGKIPLPEPQHAPVDVPPIAMHDSREIRGYGGVPKDRPFSIAEVRHYRHGYYASISFLDAQLGEILDGLDAGGHTADTLVALTSDHGFHIGEQSLWGKTSNFELDARVPLIIADPRHPAGHGQTTAALAELVDLYPTLASLAGIAADLPERLEGDNLAAVVADPAASVKQAAFTQHQHPFYGPPTNWKAWGYSIRTADWRYTEWRAIDSGELVARELYDHVRDPGESRNVAGQHPDVVKSHATRLNEHFSLLPGAGDQTESAASSTLGVPVIDISQDTRRHVIVEEGTAEVYQGHPTTVLLPDGRTLFAVWTYGHGGPCGPMKKSTDGGKTWSELLPVPDSWRRVRNCPAIYRLVDPAGKPRLFVFAVQGDGLVSSFSEDDGATWTEMRPIEGLNLTKSVMPWCTIVPIEGGQKLLAATNARRADDPDPRSNNVVQSVSEDGGLTWGPVRVICDLPGFKPCEPCFVRSPDGKQLLCLLRENVRSVNSRFIVSQDEGRTWSDPKFLPASLTGDRHQARYAPDGRLVVVFRDMAAESPTRGHFVGWVGTYDDIVHQREGRYRLKLLHNYAGTDCGYGGLELLPGGTFVATTYIKYWPDERKHSVVSTRFTLEEFESRGP